MKTNKSELLAIIIQCKEGIKAGLKNCELTDVEREKLTSLLTSLINHQKTFEKMPTVDDETFIKYFNKFNDLNNYIKKLNEKKTAMIVYQKPNAPVINERKENTTGQAHFVNPTDDSDKNENEEENSKHRVTSTVKKKDQSDVFRKSVSKNKGCLNALIKSAGVLVVAALLLTAAKEFTKNKGFNLLPSNPGYEDTYYNLPSLTSVNINDYDALASYATQVQNALPEGSKISIEEIMYAIRLANFDQLHDKAVFRDRDEIYRSTDVIGLIMNTFGSDSIVKKDANSDIFISEDELKDIILCATDNGVAISSFDDAKTRYGYDIYKVVDICTRKFTRGDENSVNFAKVLNDIMARKLLAFSITPDSPISSYYILLGSYNNSMKKNLDLTSGLGLTSVYGDGVRIDGYYGFICTEELAVYLKTGNEDNLFYTELIDNEITSYSNGRNR